MRVGQPPQRTKPDANAAPQCLSQGKTRYQTWLSGPFTLVLRDTGRPFRRRRQAPRIVLPDIRWLPLGGWFGLDICWRRLALQRLKKSEAWKAVDSETLGTLIGLDRLECRWADDAIRLAGHEAVRDEKPLKFRALLERKMSLVGRPGMHERTAAAQPVREMADGKSVGLSHIVVQYRAEIVEHEEGRAARAFRREQARLIGGARIGRAVHPHDAHPLPVAERLQRILADQLGIKALWQHDLIAPALPALPTCPF